MAHDVGHGGRKADPAGMAQVVWDIELIELVE